MTVATPAPVSDAELTLLLAAAEPATVRAMRVASALYLRTWVGCAAAAAAVWSYDAIRLFAALRTR